VIDRYILSEVYLARLKLARGDVASAAAMLAETPQSMSQNNFAHRIPDVAAQRVIEYLHQGNLAAAAQLAQAHELPISQAQVLLAQGERDKAGDCWVRRWRWPSRAASPSLCGRRRTDANDDC
jgi:LuxR family maltose regulon positive regulatory protein